MKKENKKIIFICGSFYNDNDYEKLGTSFWENHGYSIEVWCLAEIIYKNVKGQKRDDMVYFHNYFDLMVQVLKKKKCIFFDCLGTVSFDNLGIRLLNILAHVNCYSFFRDPILDYMNADIDIGISDSKGSFCARMLAILKQERFLGAFKYIVEHLLYRFRMSLLLLANKYILSINRPKIVFLSALKNYYDLPQSYRKCQIEYLHAWDYEKYLIDKTKNSFDVVSEGRYIVYLDEANVNHPDYQYCKMENYYANDGNEKKYYNSICTFFSYLEKKFNCPVIIAAHPRADYHGNEYGKRRIVKYKTLELVKKADLVVTMCSTAINFAILYRVPFILVRDDIIVKHLGYKNMYKVWEKYFQIEALNFSEDIDKLKGIDRYICKADSKAYDCYMRDFIISDQRNKDVGFWEKVLMVINKKYK